MWTFNKEDLVEEVKIGGTFLNKSGAYEMTIDAIEDKLTTNGAKQVVFKFSNEAGAKVNIFYTYGKINGEMIDFKVRNLNHLCNLLKVMPEKLSAMQGREVGVFLKADGTSRDGKFINWDIDGFYDTKTKGTAKELTEKKDIGVAYEKMVAKYEKEKPVETVRGDGVTSYATTTTTTDKSDDFPFN
jgi:hypothetical protein